MSRFYIDNSAAIVMLDLCRISLLLAMGWVLHAVLRSRNPWLSVWTWRAILVGVCTVALATPYLPGWGPRFDSKISCVNYPTTRIEKTGKLEIAESEGMSNLSSESSDMPNDHDKSLARSATATEPQTNAAIFATTIQQLPFETVLWSGYVVVVGALMFRLFFQALAVRQIVRRAEPADDLETLVRAISQSVGLMETPRVLISAVVSVPLATGIRCPTIVLPEGMAEKSSKEDLKFMIAHECCHFAGRDLIWSLAARIVQILLWPHPLAWGLSSAHRFVCDLRCDATASGQDSAGYSKMLASLAISLHSPSMPALTMAFAGQSDAVRRVNFLDSAACRARPSRLRQIAAAIGLGISFFVAGTVGINNPQSGEVLGQSNQDDVKLILVTVVDQDGKPVEGAIVEAPNLRTRKNPDSHHGNPSSQKTKTNQKGIAGIQYPKYVYEKMETGVITLTVEHPEFVPFYGDQSVDSPIHVKLDHGRRVRMSAKDSATGKRITERLFVLLSDRWGDTLPWKLQRDGISLSRPLSNETRLMLLVCSRDGQPTMFSDLIDLAKYPAGDVRIEDIPLSLGRIVKGRLGDEVPRPIVDGKVGLVVASSVSDSPAFDNSIIWEDCVPTDVNGNFEFASVPRNETVQLVGRCRGWVSVSPIAEQMRKFDRRLTDEQAEKSRETSVVAQHISASNSDPIDMKMEPLASCKVTIQDEKGNPIPHVTVGMGSHTCWFPDFTGGINYFPKSSTTLGLSPDEALAVTHKLVIADPANIQGPATDLNGQVTIHDLAGKKDIWVCVDHKKFELPTSNKSPFHRFARVDLTPGKTTEIKLTLQPTGTEIIGR